MIVAAQIFPNWPSGPGAVQAVKKAGCPATHMNTGLVQVVQVVQVFFKVSKLNSNCQLFKHPPIPSKQAVASTRKSSAHPDLLDQASIHAIPSYGFLDRAWTS